MHHLSPTTQLHVFPGLHRVEVIAHPSVVRRGRARHGDRREQETHGAHVVPRFVSRGRPSGHNVATVV
jgi:hypothetical protein